MNYTVTASARNPPIQVDLLCRSVEWLALLRYFGAMISSSMMRSSWPPPRALLKLVEAAVANFWSAFPLPSSSARPRCLCYSFNMFRASIKAEVKRFGFGQVVRCFNLFINQQQQFRGLCGICVCFFRREVGIDSGSLRVARVPPTL